MGQVRDNTTYQESGLEQLLDPHVDTSKPPTTRQQAAEADAAPAHRRRRHRGNPAADGYLNLAQIEAIAMHAGASRSEAVRLAAIAMAESGGHIGAHNPVPPDNSYGLWQINMLGDMGPSRRREYGIRSNNALFDPLTNARAALKVLRSQGWGAWSTYSNGAYEQFIPHAQQAIEHAPNVDVSRIHVSGHSYASTVGGGGTGGALDTAQPLTVRQYLDDPVIQNQYGYLAAFLHNKEVGPILARAARNGWGANRLLGALEKTEWWQKTSASARQWQAQQEMDPASARQRLVSMRHQVQSLAQATLGYRLDPQRAQHLANTAIAADWSQQDLQHAVGAEFHYQQKTTYGGAAGQTIDKFKQMASEYLVPLSDHALNRWTKGVLEGVYQPEDFKSYVEQHARNLYPTLADAFDRNLTTRQYLEPYSQLAAQTLEINPEQIDWMHPKWSKALNTTTPTGERAPMSLSDWGSYLRGLPDYKKTSQAAEQGATLARALLTTFGKVGA